MADAFSTSWPSVTCPSPAMTTLPFLRTQRMVVERILCFIDSVSGFRLLASARIAPGSKVRNLHSIARGKGLSALAPLCYRTATVREFPWACGPPKVMKTMRENRLAGGSACPTLDRTGLRFEWGRRFRLPTGVFNGVGFISWSRRCEVRSGRLSEFCKYLRRRTDS